VAGTKPSGKERTLGLVVIVALILALEAAVIGFLITTYGG
jgi:hypothetical protein